MTQRAFTLFLYLFLSLSIVYAKEEGLEPFKIQPPEVAPPNHPNVQTFLHFGQRYVIRKAENPDYRYTSHRHAEAWQQYQSNIPELNQLTDVDYDIRYEIFSTRMDQIATHNEAFARGEVHYELTSHHPFMHVPQEELETRYMGLVLPEGLLQHYATHSRQYQHRRPRQQYASSIDWTTRGKVTGVKNQGSCGSCWAFASTSVLESQYLIQANVSLSLSEQELIDCTYTSDANQWQWNHGCKGGNPSNVFEWLKSQYIVEAKYYPYTSANSGSFDANSGYTESCKTNLLTHGPIKVSQYSQIYNYNGQPLSQVESQIIDLLQDGPVTTMLYAGTDFMSYQSGVYSSTSCQYMPNHAVTIVGYGVDNQSGKKFWKIKNSWGSWWGSNGYVYVERGVNMCNVEYMLAQPTIQVVGQLSTTKSTTTASTTASTAATTIGTTTPAGYPETTITARPSATTTATTTTTASSTTVTASSLTSQSHQTYLANCNRFHRVKQGEYAYLIACQYLNCNMEALRYFNPGINFWNPLNPGWAICVGTTDDFVYGTDKTTAPK